MTSENDINGLVSLKFLRPWPHRTPGETQVFANNVGPIVKKSLVHGVFKSKGIDDPSNNVQGYLIQGHLIVQPQQQQDHQRQQVQEQGHHATTAMANVCHEFSKTLMKVKFSPIAVLYCILV
jgi:hypothetical protein